MPTLQEQLKYYCQVPRRTLRLLGIYPSTTKKFSKIRISLWIFCCLYSLYTTLYTAIISWPDIIQIAVNICAHIASFIVTSKFINFLEHIRMVYSIQLNDYGTDRIFPNYVKLKIVFARRTFIEQLDLILYYRIADKVYRQHFAKLLHVIEEELWVKYEDSPQEEKDIMLDYGKFCYYFTTFVMITMSAAGPLWLVEPFFKMAGIAPNIGNQTGLILPFDTYLFGVDTHDHPLYEILYSLQNFSTAISTAVLIGADTLFIMLVTSLCAQFRILQHRIRTFAQKETDEKKQELYLYKCVKFHQELCQYCNDLEFVETKMVLVQFFVTASFDCINLIILSFYTGSAYNVVRNIIFITAASWELFVYCYTGELLTTECFQVSQAAYESQWFNSSNNVRKIILTIITRAQKPFHLTAWGFTPASVESFEMVIRTAVSYFTVFNSVKDKF